MAGRRGDTKQRIQQVALELFAEQGYDKTSLKEVAARLGITRPALYYHFQTKEEILNGVVDDMATSLDELLAWARAQPRTAEARKEVLRHIAATMADRWLPFMRFAQVNEAAMQDLEAGARMRERMMALMSVLVDPDEPPTRRFESRLAVIAMILGTVPLFADDIPDAERAAIALDVAARLAG